MNIMRYTVIDGQGTVSFVAPCEALLPLVAGCARDPVTLQELLAFADEYATGTRERVLCGLAVFDEHNGPDSCRAIHGALDYYRPHELPVFRVVDDRTREVSLRPVHAGAVVFNLLARRIIQIQNSFAEITRRGRSRVENPASPDRRVVKYELPPYWSLVPGA